MPTSYRTRTLSARPYRGQRPHRVLRPVSGQCFEIVIRQGCPDWLIEIPEIAETTVAPTRAGAESAARDRIATSTGIPIGYVSVWVRDDPA